MYQAQVSKDGGPWTDQGPAMPQFLVKENVRGHRQQAEATGEGERYEFRIVEVDPSA